MKVSGKRWILHNGRGDEFSIWNMSDIHFGNKACAIDEFIKDRETVLNDPFAFFIGGGDYCDNISCTDKRFDPDCVADFVKIKDLGKLGKTLTEGIRELFKPIKHKCLGLLYGNHELKYEKWQEQQGLHEWLCTELGVPNLGYSALFDVVFERGKTKEPVLKFEASKTINDHHSQSFRFYVHHGAGFSTTPAGKLTRLIRFMSYFDANVFMTGHVHDQEGRRMVEIGADSTCTKLIEKHKLGIISGSYLKTYEENVTTYGEQRGYEPTVLGASKVILLPQAKNPKDRIRGEI